MRVVADANVFVSAALGRSPESPSVRIIHAALDGRIELVMCPALLAEIADVLSRPHIRKRLSAADAHQFLADVAAQGIMLADLPDPPKVCREPTTITSLRVPPLPTPESQVATLSPGRDARQGGGGLRADELGSRDLLGAENA